MHRFLRAALACGILALSFACRSLSDESTPLALRVAVRGSDVELTWNPNSPVIQSATSGVLSIDDGGLKKDIELDRNQLRSPSIVYSPVSNKVTFRLVVRHEATIETVSVQLRNRAAEGANSTKAAAGIASNEATTVAGNTARPPNVAASRDPGSGFAVQLGLFSTRPEAERYASIIRREQLRVELRGSGTNLRLWAGCLTSSEAAASLADRLRQRFPGALVVQGCDPSIR